MVSGCSDDAKSALTTPAIDGQYDGTQEFLTNIRVVDFDGMRVGDTLEAMFTGRTPQVGSLVIDWNGSFSATRERPGSAIHDPCAAMGAVSPRTSATAVT